MQAAQGQKQVPAFPSGCKCARGNFWRWFGFPIRVLGKFYNQANSTTNPEGNALKCTISSSPTQRESHTGQVPKAGVLRWEAPALKCHVLLSEWSALSHRTWVKLVKHTVRLQI